jgi:hypothetical protein
MALTFLRPLTPGRRGGCYHVLAQGRLGVRLTCAEYELAGISVNLDGIPSQAFFAGRAAGSARPMGDAF